MSELQREVEQLLAEAMKQPGVAEVSRIYEIQRPAMEALDQANKAVAPHWVYSVSDSTRLTK